MMSMSRQPQLVNWLTSSLTLVLTSLVRYKCTHNIASPACLHHDISPTTVTLKVNHQAYMTSPTCLHHDVSLTKTVTMSTPWLSLLPRPEEECHSCMYVIITDLSRCTHLGEVYRLWRGTVEQVFSSEKGVTASLPPPDDKNMRTIFQWNPRHLQDCEQVCPWSFYDIVY